MISDTTVIYTDHRGAQGTTHFLRTGAGPGLILIHGLGMCGAIWQPQIAALAAKYDVIAIDILGHGKSGLPPEDASLTDYADQVLALMDAQNVDCAHIIGHSMGALIAVEFALQYPQRTKSVVAMNAVFRRGPEQRASVAQRLAALNAAEGAVGDEQTITRWFGEPVPANWSEAADLAKSCLHEVDPVGYRRAYRLFSISDTAHETQLPELRAPTLFLTGEHDPNSTPAMSRSMAGLAQRGYFDVIHGERHMMGVTAPEEVNRRLLAFLEEHETGYRELSPTDPIALRKALGAFVTGVTIVATIDNDGEPRGFTANSFTSVSLNPALLSVCIAKTSGSYAAFCIAENFSVNVLAESQIEISRLFSSRTTERFARSGWRKGPAGSPILEGVTAWFDCRRHSAIDAGDHLILIGEVVGFDERLLNPLAYCRGAHVTFGLPLACKLDNPVIPLRVGVILEHQGRILLVRTDDDGLEVPQGRSLRVEGEMVELLGVRARLSFLFAVFDNAETGTTSIFYRGHITELAADVNANCLIPFASIPWEKIRDTAARTMLERYVRERLTDNFGVYVGNHAEGAVQTLAKSV